jgi:hypothetical protein
MDLPMAQPASTDEFELGEKDGELLQGEDVS